MKNGIADESDSSSSHEDDDESDGTDMANSDDTIVYLTASEQSESSFKCLNCNYVTDDHVSLYNHTISKYSLPAFICDIEECCKVYVSTNGLLYHLHQHGLAKPVKCKFCNMQFSHE